jgi:hypothetical protein
MMSMPFLFITILSLAATASHAFTTSKVGSIHRVFAIASPIQHIKTVVCGHQDGMADGSGRIHDEIDPTKTVLNDHQINNEIDPNEMVGLILPDVNTLRHNYRHIFDCIVSITNMHALDVYEAICQSKKVPKFTELNQWPRKEAEEYHDQLAMNGIHVIISRS